MISLCNWSYTGCLRKAFTVSLHLNQIPLTGKIAIMLVVVAEDIFTTMSPCTFFYYSITNPTYSQFIKAVKSATVESMGTVM